MKQAGIAIDGWKLSIFDRHLTQAGYIYEKVPGFTPDAIFLVVCTENVTALAGVVKAANDEAAQTGKPS